MTARATHYANYLELDALLSLQKPRAEPCQHDELVFILVHQVYELWFRAVLHELDAVCEHLRHGERAASVRLLARLRTLWKTMVAQIDVVETITPTSFLAFRERLESASGLESIQFREIAFLCGHKEPHWIDRVAEPQARARLERRFSEPTLRDAWALYLARRGYAVPESLLERDVRCAVEPCKPLHAVLIEVYRRDAPTAELCERLVDLDEGMQEWHYRHVKMVERTIGGRPGTGGSSGVEYLRSTLFRPSFPELWSVRDDL